MGKGQASWLLASHFEESHLRPQTAQAKSYPIKQDETDTPNMSRLFIFTSASNPEVNEIHFAGEVVGKCISRPECSLPWPPWGQTAKAPTLLDETTLTPAK